MDNNDFVYQDGQLFRRIESLQPVDLAQLEVAVNADEATKSQLETELHQLDLEQAALTERFNEKNAQIGEAERKLEATKRSVAAARTLVEGQDEPDGTGEAVDSLALDPTAQLV